MGLWKMAGNTQDKVVRDQMLRGMKNGETLTESLAGRGTGSIFFKKVGATVTAYYRWNLNKVPGQLSIGQYASTPPGMRLTDIRDEAKRLAQILKEHGNPKEYLARQKAEKEAQLQAEAMASDARSKLGTFKDLLDDYVADMSERGRVKTDQVARMFQMHIHNHFPTLASKLAKEITEEDIYDVVTAVMKRSPANRGKGRTTKAPKTSMRSTADTLHTYLCAAFENAKTSQHSLKRKRKLSKKFDIVYNVAAAIGSLDDVYEGNTESLEQHELGELLRYLDTLPERHRAIALAPIYFGGQRLIMMTALEWRHIDDQGFFIFDKKGKRTKPLPHFLPWTEKTREIMAPLLQLQTCEAGPFAIADKNLITSNAASKFYSHAGKELSKAGKTMKFTWENVRVSAETLMAGIGIGPDVRAHLLSHGRSGVQSKHYDRNTYLKEKTDALLRWGEYLDDLKAGKIREGIRIFNIKELRDGADADVSD